MSITGISSSLDPLQQVLLNQATQNSAPTGGSSLAALGQAGVFQAQLQQTQTQQSSGQASNQLAHRHGHHHGHGQSQGVSTKTSATSGQVSVLSMMDAIQGSQAYVNPTSEATSAPATSSSTTQATGV